MLTMNQLDDLQIDIRCQTSQTYLIDSKSQLNGSCHHTDSPLILQKHLQGFMRTY